MEWKDILIALISVSASTVLNIIINCINNNMPFLKNKRKQKEVKKICPELVCLYTRNTNDIKSITDGSSFFEVIFDVKVDNDLKPDKKVSFCKYTLCVYDISKRLSDNGLITPEIQLRSDY